MIRDLIDPMKELMQDLPKRESMKDFLGDFSSPLISQPPSSDEVTSGSGIQADEVKLETETSNEQEDITLKESLDFLFKEEMKMFASRKNILKQNQIKLWGVIWGQCSPALQTELKGNQDYMMELSKYNGVWLLSKLKLAVVGIDRSVSPYRALVNSLTFFHTLRQQRDESIETYRRRFESAWNSAVTNKAAVGHHPAFTKFAIENDDSTSNEQEVEDKLAATYLITFADSNRFQGLWESLSNATLLGRDDYPQNITAAYDLLSHYRGSRKSNSNDGPINVSFAQVKQVRDDLPPLTGINGELQADITCWKCMRLCHISRFRPERVHVQHMQLRRTKLTHAPQDVVPENWLLLDSGSTVSSVCNSALIQNIVPIDEPVRVFTNVGSQDYV